MNLAHKYMSSASFLRSPDEGGAPVATPSAPTASGGGTASVTSPTPATPSSPAGDATTPDNSFDAFGSSDDFDSVEMPEAGTVPSPDDTVVTPAKPAVPATPAVAAPATPEVPAVPAVPVAEVPKPGASPASEIDTLTTSLSSPENAVALTNWLAENTFKLTKEEMDAFELDAVGQIPKLMAKVHVSAMKSTLNLIKNLVPNLINSQVEKTGGAKARATEAVNEFYETNSDLNAKEHGKLMDKWAKAFRAQNPSAPRAEAIKFVGQAIRTELGLPPLVPGAPAKAKPQAFAPARPGARAPVATVVEENPFAALGMDVDE